MLAAALFSVTLVAACDKKTNDPAVSATADAPNPALAGSAPGSSAALPPPEALTEVLYKLADTSVPGDQKVSLVEGATADEGAQLDRFGKALADSGYTPLGFTATEIAWSDTVPGDVSAKVSVHSENPALSGGFTFPMEFRPYFGTWQLSRKTADMLLALGNSAPPA
ncbi:MAG: hypothetical protein JO152_07915, partial [Mycobacteriaceae bacterium]|nr:hypothetical protein [Mycobacteriaceae bacterium]